MSCENYFAPTTTTRDRSPFGSRKRARVPSATSLSCYYDCSKEQIKKKKTTKSACFWRPYILRPFLLLVSLLFVVASQKPPKIAIRKACTIDET